MNVYSPKYPIVVCTAHPGEHEPGYAACPHVAAGTPPTTVELATEKELGTLACAACPVVTNEFILCCAASMRERGFIPPEGVQ